MKDLFCFFKQFASFASFTYVAYIAYIAYIAYVAYVTSSMSPPPILWFAAHGYYHGDDVVVFVVENFVGLLVNVIAIQ